MEDTLSWQGQIVKENQRLISENARLREALGRVANRMIAYAEPDEAAHDMKSIAHQALKESE